VAARISGGTQVVGVFGWPIEHSLSPPMHNAAFAAAGLDWVYVPFAVPPEGLTDAIRALPALGIVGVNCTIPHKAAVAALMDELSPVAAAAGAVNTVHVVEGRLKGYLTDGPGLLRALQEEEVRLNGQRVALIGAGGSARATAFAFVQAGVREVSVINRTAERAEKLAADLNAYAGAEVAQWAGLDSERARELVQRAFLVADSTSVGMYPQGDVPPVIPAEWIQPGQVVCDYTYNPLETCLVKAARARGARTVSGAGMLMHQGALAWERWTGLQAPVEVMRAALLEALGAEASG